jgi:uncharacterized protein
MKRIFVFAALVSALGPTGCKPSNPAPQPTTAPSSPASAAVGGKPANSNQALPANTTGQDPWAKPAAAKDPLPNPLFWSIEKDGITSYVLGTIHLGVDAESRLPPIIWSKLDRAPAFAMETDLTDPAIQDIVNCSSCSLRRDLGDAYWSKLEAALGARVAAGIESMKPMVAATAMAMHGMPQTTQMDGVLLGRAQNQSKRVIFLERADHAAKVLERWMNIKALKAMLDDREGGKARTQATLGAYLAGDEQKMLELSKQEKAHALANGYTAAEYDASMKEILLDRNLAWISPIEAMHSGGGGFIAVGALHLVGPGSVLELLTAKGYKITRISGQRT